MYPLIFKSLLEQGLADDQFLWDWTTRGSVGKADRKVSAKIVAKAAGVWAGEALCKSLQEVAHSKGYDFEVGCKMEDGRVFESGEVLCEWKGNASSVLIFERPFLNILGFSCGIAAQTHRLVKKVQNTWKNQAEKSDSYSAPRVSCTRKILPGYRDLSVYSVIAGGGHPHRLNLASGLLIKENHIAAAGSMIAAVQGVRASAPHGLKVEIEVRNLEELKKALSARVDGVLLDNFKPEEVRSALERVSKARHAVFVEVSGGIHAENIEEYVIPGVNVISVGSLTHSVKVPDLSLLVS